MKKGILVFLGVAGLAVAACKKDDKTTPGSATAALLTASAWKYDTVTLDLDKNGAPDSGIPAGYIPSCELDNTITFKSDGSGTMDEGATKCVDTAAQSTSFAWTLPNDSTLNISNNSDTLLNGNIAIQSITASQMVLVKNVVINNVFTIDANVIVTLKK